jgi:hypothetical protein
MIDIKLKNLVGQRIFVQFRKGQGLCLAAHFGKGDLDFAPMDLESREMPSPPVETYTFSVVEKDKKIVLMYDNPANCSEQLVIHHLPLELVAFVTAVDNLASQTEPSPEEAPKT